jgi:dipeptidyl aminopeptidase/acylaminoacyl peptidase
MRFGLLLTALLWSAAVVADDAPGPLPLESFTRWDEFGDVKISPDGRLLAMTLGKYGNSALAFIDRHDGKLVGGWRQPNGTVIEDFDWVSPTRVIYRVAERAPDRVEPLGTGEIFAIDVDGKDKALVYGYRAHSSSYATAYVISTLPSDPDNILVAEQPWRLIGNSWWSNPDARPTIKLLNVRNGRKRELGEAPLASAQLLVDSSEQVRFAVGYDTRGKLAVAWRPRVDDPWQEFALPGFRSNMIKPLGFNKDNSAVHFLAVPENKSHQALYRLTLASGSIDKLSLADDTEVVDAVMDLRNERVIGYETYTDKLARAWIEKDDRSARFYRALERAFPGQTISITSSTSDGSLAVAFVQSDVNPGDFYVLDTQALKADFIRASRTWIDPRTMRPREPVTLQARDGLELHGYLTRPASPPPHPMVVLPHGGPHQWRDLWEFDGEAQLLANRGYAVLQVNYRGSAGFGIDFKSSGYKEWGARMQDDLTDATRWAIEKKIAAPDRICIYGSNYGGYAALMGVAREPGLYRCAISFAGSYDLEVLQSSRRLQKSRSGRTYVEETLGDDPAQLRARSPVNLAPAIQAPVLLIHGTEDIRADINQARAMKTALERAGKRFEWLVLSREGDWIYDEETRREAYERILAFLDANLRR